MHTDDCVNAVPYDDDLRVGPGVSPADLGSPSQFHHGREQGGMKIEDFLIALAAGPDGRGAGLSPDDRAAGSPTYHPSDWADRADEPNALPMEAQKRIADRLQ